LRQRIGNYLVLLAATAVIVALFGVSALALNRLPAAKAGPISQPTGSLAFVRGNDLWTVDVSGQNQRMVHQSQNADGRPSWSPDNRRILFTRSGSVNVKSPDGLGGVHKIYDMYTAFLDSAEIGNNFFYYRISEDLGSRDPQWLPDGKVFFWKDMNANILNAGVPNYQMCRMELESGEIEVLRKDWRNQVDDFLMSPSISINGDIAYVYMEKFQSRSLGVVNESDIMLPMDSLKALAANNPTCVAPAWSPDGKWIAYIWADFNTPQIRIATPDLKEHYLVWEPPPSSSIHTVSPGFSPDSKWLTFSTTDGSVWICDITGGQVRRVTGPGADRWPAWSK